MSADLFEVVKKRIIRECGLDLNRYNQNHLRRRMNARLMLLGLGQECWHDYLRLLISDPSEPARLLDCLGVNTTEFFRDVSVWKKLARQLLPALLEQKSRFRLPTLRIWIAGCSSGEEAYSAAILVSEVSPAPRGLSAEISAADFDQEALAKARLGVYTQQALRSVTAMNPAYPGRYFTLLGQEPGKRTLNFGPLKTYRVADRIKNMVSFKNCNFLGGSPYKMQDIVFCRNVMIYMTPGSKTELLKTFYDTVAPGGLLIIGKSEVLFPEQLRGLFYPVDIGERIYRRERRKPGASDYPEARDNRKGTKGTQ